MSVTCSSANTRRPSENTTVADPEDLPQFLTLTVTEHTSSGPIWLFDTERSYIVNLAASGASRDSSHAGSDVATRMIEASSEPMPVSLLATSVGTSISSSRAEPDENVPATTTSSTLAE